MEHLSSCYFCGAAVETEVREYPIVTESPDDLDLPPVDERPTVTLCVTCRRKLDRLLATGIGDRETVGTTAGRRPADEEDRQSGTGDDPVSGSTADADGSDQARSDDRTLSDEDAGDQDDDAPSIAPDAEIFGDVDPVPPSDEREGPGDDGDDVGDDESADRPPAGTDGDDEDTEEESRPFSASQAAGGRVTSSHGEADDGGEGPEGDGDDEGAEGDREVPREAYNKVVRLLQNREFPVERADIVAVATNAYGLRRSNCEAAIDSLVEKGIVEADGDRLLRPED